jgi:phosphoserine phosphatase
LPGVLPALVRFLLGRADRGLLKSALLRAVLGGCRRSEVEEWTAQFASRVLRWGVRTDALEAIARHRREGDVLALLSASVDLYVPAIGRSLGFGEILCTGVEWNGERLSGTLATANRRGAEKVFCLAQLRMRHPQLPVTAYADAMSDLEHLKFVEHPILVNGSWRARRAAAREGIPCRKWY